MSQVNFPLALPSAEKHYMSLSRKGPLFILHIYNNGNQFTTEVCNTILYALQVVEDIFLSLEKPTPMALVTIGDAKFYSNGLDVAHSKSYIPFMDSYLLMLKRFLTFTIPTIYAFSGDCMLAMAHDYRVMRTERGYMCMNEIDLPAPLAPGMTALFRYKTTPKTLRKLILQGHRFGAEEALEHDLVDAIYPEKELLAKANDLALHYAPKAKAGIVYRQIKEELTTDTVRLLSVPYSRLTSNM